MQPVHKILAIILAVTLGLALIVASALYIFGDDLAAWYLKGKTPENTLELFITAMNDGQIGVAESYLAPEAKQQYVHMLDDARSGYLPVLVPAYLGGRVVPAEQIGEGDLYEIAVYPPESDTPFIVQLIYDELSREWKIISL